MDRVLKALKCVNCEEILRTPIILPCGHMICESHTLETNDLIICSKCGSRHPIKEFVIVEAVSDMIDAQLGHIDFGEQHTEALNSCKSLKKQIDQIDLMLNDLDYYIHETISEMKNRVILKSEQLKFKIEQVTNILIDDLEEYEKSCIRDCGENSIDDLQERNEELRKNLQEWSSVLNELKVDVKRWSGIKSECDESLRSMREKFKNFEKKVFMDELIGKKHQVALFERQIIDPFLTLKKVR